MRAFPQASLSFALPFALSLPLLLSLAALAPAAQAQGMGRAAISHNGAQGLVTNTVATGRAVAQSTRSDFDGASTRWSYIATSFADMNRGAVGADVQAIKTGLSSFFPLTVSTFAMVEEQLTFHGARAAEVEFTATLTGSFAASAMSIFRATGSLFLNATASSVDFSYTHQPLSPFRDAVVVTTGMVTDIVNNVGGMAATMHVRRLVQPGEVVGIGADFQMRVTPANNDTAVAIFGHTMQLGFVLPEGMTFTSSSGVFMTEAPGAPVPEPASAVLAFAGVLALLGKHMQARAQAGSGVRKAQAQG